MTNDGSGSVFRALADPTRRQILQDLRLRAPPGHRVAAGDSRRREAVSRLAPPCDVHGGRVRRPVPGGDDKPRRTGADAVAAHVADLVAPGSVFGDLESASRFFGGSPVGYSSRQAAPPSTECGLTATAGACSRLPWTTRRQATSTTSAGSRWAASPSTARS